MFSIWSDGFVNIHIISISFALSSVRLSPRFQYLHCNVHRAIRDPIQTTYSIRTSNNAAPYELVCIFPINKNNNNKYNDAKVRCIETIIQVLSRFQIFISLIILSLIIDTRAFIDLNSIICSKFESKIHLKFVDRYIRK